MKVLHIISGLGDGGAEATLFRLCKADVRNQHSVISLGGPGKYSRLLEDIGVSVMHMGMSGAKIMPSNVVNLFRSIRRSGADVVQTWMYHADFLGALVGRAAGRSPICWGVHNSALVPGRSKRSTIFISRINAVLSKILPVKIVYCADKAKIVHEEIGYSGRYSRVIHNGYDLDQFKPDESSRLRMRNQLGVATGDFVVGMVARFDPMKDHKNFFAALKEVNESGVSVKVVMVGTRIEHENHELTDLLTQSNLSGKVILLGARSDVNVLMCAFDVCTLSSIKEAFPNVLAEAMACGTPCISTDVGDATEIVGGTGWVVAPSDPGALAEALIDSKREWSDQDSWHVRQHAVRARIEQRFSLQKMVDAYNVTWDEAVHSAFR